MRQRDLISQAEKRRGPRSTRIKALQIQQASVPLSMQSESPRYDHSMSPLAANAGPTPVCSSTPVGDTATQALDYVDGANSSDEWLQQMLEPNLPEDVFDGFPGPSVVTGDFRTLPFVVSCTTCRKGLYADCARIGQGQAP